MLTYNDALNLLNSCAKDHAWKRHCQAVSHLAGYFAEVFKAKHIIDVPFLKRAALLHDIGRYKTHDPILHGVEGYKLLIRLGHQREAFVCASHVLFGIDKKEAIEYGLPERDFIPISIEEKLVPLVDSLVECDTPTTLEKRFQSLKIRYADNEKFLRKLTEAEEKTVSLMQQLEQEFNISMEKMVKEALSHF